MNFTQIITHEFCHNLGIHHENAPENIELNCTARWNECNRRNFVTFYNKKKDNWCMEEKEDACCEKEPVDEKGKCTVVL